MLYTNHFNLMLPEGTDVVNPLVQQNPNFSDIDTIMYGLKQTVVGSATELTAGTVHTITRANTDSNVIRFTATSNWAAGDSMVIDSTPVSVYLSDGTTPDDGAYIINSEVLVLLSGTRATLIVSNKIGTAYDIPYDANDSIGDKIDGIIADSAKYAEIGKFNYTLPSLSYTVGSPERFNVPLQTGETDASRRISVIPDDMDFVAFNTVSGRVYVEQVSGTAKTATITLTVRYLKGTN